MEQQDPQFLNSLVILQSSIESVEEKVNALRYLKQYLDNHVNMINNYQRKKINQLIIDNVMKIIINSSNQSNGFRRQLVRVELFVLLSQLLRSSSLFGAELTQSVIHDMQNYDPLSVQNSSSWTEGEDENQNPSIQGVPEINSLQTEEMRRFHSRQSTASIYARNALTKEIPGKSIILFGDNSNAKRPKTSHEHFPKLHPVETLQLFSKSTKINTQSNGTRLSASSSMDFIPSTGLIKATLAEKKPKVELNSKLKPRPSVLFDDKLQSDSFVPGADPKNFLEQDRKLGYQKPRMWFPIPQLDLMSSISKTKKNEGSNPIVEEYLKMKSLATYVGDLIIPPNSTATHSKNPSTAFLKSHSAVVDAKRYSHALREAMLMWTPILNAHRPNQLGKKRKISYISDDHHIMNDPDRNDILPSSPSHIKSPPPRLFYEESVSYEPFELYQQDYRNEQVNNSILDYNRYQTKLTSTLSKQSEYVFDSLRSIQSRMNQLVDKSYNTFHRQYLLLLEGSESKSRRLLFKLTKYYLKTKRRNHLLLAFGLWKIQIIEARSLEKRPLYAKVASCHLIAAWYNRQRLKNFKLWVQRWRKCIVWMIFKDRNTAVVRIQTVYRMKRDCLKLIARHKAGPYLGILSDIELLPERTTLPFRIPKIIRSERRMYWLAATKIQSLYRCWISCRDYFKKKRQLILLQSLFRMWPVFKRYRRLRATTIKCQAWSRRTVKRKQYLRKRKAALIIQKYVRRYLAILLRQRLFDQSCSTIEERIYAAIKIQCRYRIRLAKKVIKRLKFKIKLIEYSVLVIQRSWYRYKGAFHTFLLMCCLRVREEEDLGLEDLATKMGRLQYRRRIQRFYRFRYFKRNIESVIKVQCWFRGRLGYNLVTILRKQRWASRKLRHWAHFRLLRRNFMARKIQRWWWKRKKLRLLKHLWAKAKNQDYTRRKRIAEAKYHAACRIQALVRGIWDRRWVRRHKAALLIQKNLKVFHGIRKLKRRKRDRNLKTVRKFVTKFMDAAVFNQLRRILHFHNTVIVKPQALIRRYLVRSAYIRAQERAYAVGLAVVKIQRTWRTSGEISKAVEEVLARKRAESNPFKDCLYFHDILLVLMKECKPYYYPYDPRIGMKLSTFFFRLGMIELFDLFPKRNYIYVIDLAKISIEKLNELFTINQGRGSKKNDQKKKPLPLFVQTASASGGGGGGGGGKKKSGPPSHLFQLLLEILRIPFTTRSPGYVRKLSHYLLPITDYLSPNDAYLSIRKAFLKRFGKHLQTRATNVSREIVEMYYPNYHHYHINNLLIPTMGFIQYILQVTTESTNVITNLQELQQFYQQNYLSEEKKWDLERMKQSSQLLQLALDRSLQILPKRSFMRNQMDILLNRIIAYKRKATYILKKVQDAAAAAIAAPTGKAKLLNKTPSKLFKKPGSPGTDGQIDEKKRSPPSSDAKQAPPDEVSASEILPTTQIPPEKLHQRLHPEDLLIDSNAVVYDGDNLFDYDLDYYYNLTKSFSALFFRFYILSLAIQSIKNHWSNQALNRAMITEKRNRFLETITNQYLTEQSTNHVYKLWAKMKKLEIMNRKINNIIQLIRDRQAWIEEQLQYTLRYYIAMYQDDFGYYYYVDEAGLSSYDPPVYSYEQWIAVEKIQRKARKYIVGARARRLEREEAERQLIALQEAKLLEERKQAMKAVTVKLLMKSFTAMMMEKVFIRRGGFKHRPTSHPVSRRQTAQRRLSYAVIPTHGAKLADEDVKDSLLTSEDPIYQNILSHIDLTTIDEHLDAMIPHSFRFDYSIAPKTGIWALYTTPTTKEPILGQKLATYQVVILFKIRKAENLCDIRTVKGNITNNISFKRIRHLHYQIGMKVECRYKHRKLFYRAVIIDIQDRRHQSGYQNQFLSYTVKYEDNEIEYGLQRDAIRPMVSNDELKKWIDRRESYLQKARRQYRRKIFYKLQRHQRVKDTISYYITRSIERANGGGGGHGSVGGEGEGSQSSLPAIENASSEGVERAETNEIENDHPDVSEDPNKDNIEANHEGSALTTPPRRHSNKPTADTNEISPEITGHEGGDDNQSLHSESTTVSYSKRTVSFFHQTATVSPGTSGGIHKTQHANVTIPFVRVKIRYTRQVPKYPWQIIAQPITPAEKASNFPTILYNPHTEEETEDLHQTMYTAKELHVIKKIQLRWLVFRAIKQLKKKTMSIDIKALIETTIIKGKKIGYIGYKLEGLTAMQLLNRAGYHELADIIIDYYTKILQKSMNQFPYTIEDIALTMITKEMYEKHLGIYQTNHIRDLKEFQTWWKKTSPFERENKLSLFNYYLNPNDSRSLKQCIIDSLEILMKKFSKYLKGSSTKTKKSCEAIVEASFFPHSHLQVETYLKRYSDKPELAREYVMELVNKLTVHTYVEESKVLKLFYHTALQVSRILAVYRLKQIRNHVLDAIRRVEILMKEIAKINLQYTSSSSSSESKPGTANAAGGTPGIGGGGGGEESHANTEGKVKGRPLHSGPEAKAAWIIREEIFQYLLTIITATSRIQCRWKAYSYRQKFKTFLLSRITAIDSIQRCIRRYFAYQYARYLRKQKESPWEQLWNSQYNLLYYYNYITGQSQYQEPNDLYRPLIRDKRSAQLIQAWPELDEQRNTFYNEIMEARANVTMRKNSYYKNKNTLPVMSKSIAKEMGMMEEIPSNLLCIICQVRRVIRFCLHCSYEIVAIMNKSRMNTAISSPGKRLSLSSAGGGGGIGSPGGGRRISGSAGYGGAMPGSPGRFQKPVPYCLPCYLKEHDEANEEKFHHKFQLAMNAIPPVEGSSTALIPLSPGRPSSPIPTTQPLLLEDGSSLEGSLEEPSSEITMPFQMVPFQPSKSLAPASNFLYLKCCMCERPATRKCQGLLHDEDVQNLLTQLKKCPKSEWRSVLQPFTSLTSETKLLLLIEEIIHQDQDLSTTEGNNNNNDNDSLADTASANDTYIGKMKGGGGGGGGDSQSVHSTDSYYNTLSPNQLQQIKHAFEKLRTECDECYCTSCYRIVHSGGKRQYHYWKGFQEYAMVCSVCQDNPSEYSCVDCVSNIHQHLPPNLENNLDNEEDYYHQQYPYEDESTTVPNNNNNNNGSSVMTARENKKSVEYCQSCFHVYHTIGRKKRHKKDMVYEKHSNNPNYYADVMENQPVPIPEDNYCSICMRRLGEKCIHEECLTIVCEECFEFKHQKRCKYRPQDPTRLLLQSRRMTTSPSSRNLSTNQPSMRGSLRSNAGTMKSTGTAGGAAGDLQEVCVVCGEIADKKCLQCGDFYCSRTWMGNPGCFIQYHSKGNRATHRTQFLSELGKNDKPLISFSSLVEQGKFNLKPGKSFSFA